MGNQLWELEPGWLAAYIEDRELIRKIKRHKKDWPILVDYFKNNYLTAVIFRVPSEQRQAAERWLFSEGKRYGT